MSQFRARRSPTRNQRAEIFLAAKGICYLCGLRIKAERGEKWEAEHPHARELGGSDDIAELRPAHVSCHKVKTKADRKEISRSNGARNLNLGIKKPSKFQTAKTGPYKQKMDGTLVYRATGQPVRPR